MSSHDHSPQVGSLKMNFEKYFGSVLAALNLVVVKRNIYK